jgi:hypothetical protein
MKAFPQHIFDEGQILIGEDLGGMNLRDWFAGMALPSLLNINEGDLDEKDITTWAYELANAMMKARKAKYD